jgi:hypothetical protein
MASGDQGARRIGRSAGVVADDTGVGVAVLGVTVDEHDRSIAEQGRGGRRQPRTDDEEAVDSRLADESWYLRRAVAVVDHERAEPHIDPDTRTCLRDRTHQWSIRGLRRAPRSGDHEHPDRELCGHFSGGADLVPESARRVEDPLPRVVGHAGLAAQGERGGSSRNAGRTGDLFQRHTPAH